MVRRDGGRHLWWGLGLWPDPRAASGPRGCVPLARLPIPSQKRPPLSSRAGGRRGRRGTSPDAKRMVLLENHPLDASAPGRSSRIGSLAPPRLRKTPRSRGCHSPSVSPLTVSPSHHLTISPLTISPLTISPLTVSPLTVSPLTISPSHRLTSHRLTLSLSFRYGSR